MIERYQLMGFAGESHLYYWAAQGALVRSGNYSKVRVLGDLGFDTLSRLSCEAKHSTIPINKGAADVPFFPIYPEMAAPAGARGSYRFKPVASNGRLTFRGLIELTFVAYGAVSRQGLAVADYIEPRLQSVIAAIREQRGSQVK